VFHTKLGIKSDFVFVKSIKNLIVVMELQSAFFKIEIRPCLLYTTSLSLTGCESTSHIY
jgi:hypothetical protein